MNFINFVTQTKNIFFFASALLTGIYLVVISNKKNIFAINVLETINLINNKHAIILDLRIYSNFQKYHIAQSINIQIDSLDSYLKNISQDKNIIFIHDDNSFIEKLIMKLRKEGFINTFYLSNGMDAWISNDLPVIKDLDKK
ncbi:MAG: rhodanese-like domain-containing protein [Candidatus Kinetoplastibacterium crithidii]|nr:MAG: rhodanese-like domain-containing protein [Candidatus Kinetoplastibacterium crithidii]